MHQWTNFLSIGVPGIIGAECACGLISLVRDGDKAPDIARCPNDRDEPGPGPGETVEAPLSAQPAGTVLSITMADDKNTPQQHQPAAAGDTHPAAAAGVRQVTGRNGEVIPIGIATVRPPPDPALHRKFTADELAARGIASTSHVAR